MFSILTFVVLLAVLSVSICAVRNTVSVGTAGTGYLNSFTGSTYTDTVAYVGNSVNEYVSVDLYFDGSIEYVSYKDNLGYTTAYIVVSESGNQSVGAFYRIRRSGVLHFESDTLYY